MTDERLIKETAKAIRVDLERQNESRHDGPYMPSEDADDAVLIDGVINLVEAARAAWAVFEAAHAPTDDERVFTPSVDAVRDVYVGGLVEAGSATEQEADAEFSRFVAALRRSEVPRLADDEREPKDEPSIRFNPDAPIPYAGTTDDFMVNTRAQGEPAEALRDAIAEGIGCNICGEALPDGEPHLCSTRGEPSQRREKLINLLHSRFAWDSGATFEQDADAILSLLGMEPQGEPSDAQKASIAADALEQAVSDFENDMGIQEFDEATSTDGRHWVEIEEAWNHQGPFMEWLRVRARALRAAGGAR